MKQYVLAFSDGDPFSAAAYLVLLGPFCYERSTADVNKATLLTQGQAYRYQYILGGEVVQVSVG